MAREGLSVYIACKDNPEILNQCINQLLWADEILVADASIGGDIEKLIQSMPPHVRHFANKTNHLFDRAREVLRHASNQYILFVDSDEIYNEELSCEIKAELSIPCDYSGFYIPQNYYSYGCYLGPGEVWLRLVKYSDLVFPEGQAHGLFSVLGPTKVLKTSFTHLNNPKLGMNAVKHFRYAAITSSSSSLEALAQHRLDQLNQVRILLHAVQALCRINWRFFRRVWFYRRFRFAGLCLAYGEILRAIADDVAPTEECRMREGSCERDNRGYF